MKKQSYVIATILIIALAGCSAPPKVASQIGIIETKAFEPIFISQSPGSPQKVLFRTHATPFVSETEFSRANFSHDILVIADTGVYSTNWNPDNSEFNTKFFIKKQDIKSTKIVEFQSTFFANCHALNIETYAGLNVKFCLSKELGVGAKLILDDTSYKNNKQPTK